MVSLKDHYLVHCFFQIYINDLPKISSDDPKIVLLTDDASIIITNSNPTNFKDSVIKIFQGIKTWFSTNLLSLNTDKTHFMQFVTKNSYLTFRRRNFLLNFSTPVFKMWIIQEPKKVALWNKRHFEEEKRVCSMFKIFSTYICWINT
jgi:hypothetical protein